MHLSGAAPPPKVMSTWIGPTSARNEPMTSSYLKSVLCVAAMAAATMSEAQPQSTASAQAQQITRAGTQPSAAGPAEFFTGRVRVDPVWPANGEINASGGMVTFEPGARSAWHTHPKGQRLVVVSGVGRTQEWGKATQEIRPGDVVWCPPGVKHWHGAAPTTAMSHLAVTGTLDGKNVEWMEKVSDEQYNAK
jgi:quercetin dioxygenase-like cupin family protein